MHMRPWTITNITTINFIKPRTKCSNKNTEIHTHTQPHRHRCTHTHTEQQKTASTRAVHRTTMNATLLTVSVSLYVSPSVCVCDCVCVCVYCACILIVHTNKIVYVVVVQFRSTIFKTLNEGVSGVVFCYPSQIQKSCVRWQRANGMRASEISEWEKDG